MTSSNAAHSTAKRPTPSNPLKQAPLWLLALITFSGTVAMHMFVPALPAAAHDFQVSPSYIQLTLSAYIIGLAVGQLFYGPISDRLGRKKVLLCGVMLFCVGSVGAWTASSIQMLIAARLIQALGGCSGLVLGKAIILDTVKGAKATQRLALLSLIVMIGPGLAPLIGMALVKLDGWRLIFAALSLFGVSSLILIWRMLPESSPHQGQSFQTVVFNYATLLKSPRFWGFSLGGSLATTSLYAYITAAPFIFIRDLHTSESEMALFLALNIFGAWLGNICVTHLIFRVTAKRLLQWGTGISFVAVIVLCSSALLGALSKYILVGLMMIYTLGAGIISPVAMSEALSVNPQVAGSASGIYGFFQMGVGALASYLATLGDTPLVMMIFVLLTCLLLAKLCLRMAYRTHSSA
ncbi:multidrug effflux MFS transporter [Pseudomonas sp. A-R-19]|uniref:multidrug effflux MFS transporter n=1 Tax=Pseudomonas sp. A-R-19 TaxID=2832403 RepID=UPI001CC1B80B|nr:multidrug effflux MFS transporter [Pseudomonas sp. A-R-19]